MDRLHSMRVFVTVAEMGSFAKAARHMDVSAPVVTRLVADLEGHLRTRLLHRSTRTLSLTEAGEAYLERCRAILNEIDDAEAWLSDQTSHVGGELRILCPTSFGINVLMPLLARYVRRHPQVTLDLVLTDRPVDMVAERFDLAVVLNQLGVPEGLVARNFLRASTLLCASPAYLAARGTPALPEDIRDHDCLNYAHPITRHGWDLYDESGQRCRAEVHNLMTCNTVDALIHAARADMGICVALECLVRADLEKGTLVRVLPRFTLLEIGFQIVYPSRKYLPGKVRAAIDFLLAEVA